MALFMSRFVNKVDRKGRVSVPAAFRSALQGQSFHGIVAIPSFREQAIIGCGMDFMERIADGMEEHALFSDAQDDLSAAVFAAAHQLGLDGEGRIMLNQELAAHAGIEDQAAFVGRGRTFEIWEPGAFEAHLESARQNARSGQTTLQLRPGAGGGE